MNIFKDAKFGDKFRTRAGKMAIYVVHEDDRYGFVVDGFCETMPYILEDGICKIARYNINGNPYLRTQYSPSMDIISKWEELIDEEKLNKLAEEYEGSINWEYDPDYAMYSSEQLINAYKAGYRNDKEE